MNVTIRIGYDATMTMFNLSDTALLSHATPGVFARGQEYAASGEELLRPLSCDQLHNLRLTLAQRMPAILEPLEHESLRQQTTPEAEQTAPPASPRRRTPVDTRTYERQAKRLFGAIEQMSSGMALYDYASTVADGMHDLIGQAAAFTRNGDGNNLPGSGPAGDRC